MQPSIEIITEIFADLLQKPGLKLALADSPSSLDGWDSLTHPELIAGIEEKLDINFDFKELAAIKTIADLVQLTDTKRNNAGK
jgi:acyl carrier protein